jgi:hypothetical protein
MLGIKVERTPIRGKFAKEIRECVRRAYLAEKEKSTSSAASTAENIAAKNSSANPLSR